MVAREIPRPGGRDPHPIRYRLKRYNGGRDPFADHPATWAPDWGVWVCDCAGFVCWAMGVDRFQPGHETKSGKLVGKYEFWGGYINTDSMIAEAERDGKWFEVIDKPEPGCLVVTRSSYKNGKRTRVGHVMMCVTVFPNGQLMIVDCSGSANKTRKQAISVKRLKPTRRHVMLRFRKAKSED